MQEGQFDYMYSTPPQSPERTARVRRIGRLEDIYRSLYSGINVKGAKMVPADRQIVKTSEGVRYMTDAPRQKHIFNGLDPAAEGGKYTFALSNG